jgi:hypothetical protein
MKLTVYLVFSSLTWTCSQKLSIISAIITTTLLVRVSKKNLFHAHFAAHSFLGE